MKLDMKALMKAHAWCWTPGMAYGPDKRITERTMAVDFDCVPDLDDAMTEECVLDVARKAWNEPTLRLVRFTDWDASPSPRWYATRQLKGEPVQSLWVGECGDEWVYNWIEAFSYSTAFESRAQALATLIIAAPKIA